MLKAWLLRLHRWTALLFALPILIVIGTGVVLSFEPWVVSSAAKRSALTSDRLGVLLARHDPSGEARAIAYRSYDGTLTIGGRGGKVLDVASGEVKSVPSSLSLLFVTARRIHETMLLDLGWLVIAASAAMLTLALLGILMGWPLLSNTLGGWHKAVAWGLLPLIVLSPLTGILLAAGVTLSRAPTPGQEQGPPLKLTEAVRTVGAKHDLSGLIWLRPSRGRLLMRIVEDGEYKVYAVTRDGTLAIARNWPRLWHEGAFAGAWSALMNIVTSIAMLALLVTGVSIWLRRYLRRARRASPPAVT